MIFKCILIGKPLMGAGIFVYLPERVGEIRLFLL